MILGEFDDRGRPYVTSRLIIPRLQINEGLLLLLDTGADRTCLHPRDAVRIRMPFGQLADKQTSRGVGGRSSYFREQAIIAFRDRPQLRLYAIELLVAEPQEDNDTLPSLLGRDIINQWYMQYDPTNTRLEFVVRSADHTLSEP